MWVSNFALGFLLVFAAAPALSDDSFSDLIIDGIISEMSEELLSTDDGEVSLPELSGSVKKKVVLVTVSASFLGQGGFVKNLTTIERTGSSEMTSTDNSVAIEVDLGVGDLEFGFTRFRISVAGMKLHGHLNASIGTNSVHVGLNVTTNDDGSCETTLTALEITELDDISVKISGHNKVADWIYNEIASVVIKELKSKITSAVETALSTALETVLANYDLCSSLI